MIVDTGVEVMKFRLISGTTDYISHVSIGSGTTVPIRTATTMGSEYERKAATITHSNGSPVKITLAAEWTSTSFATPKTISNAGIFTQATSGSLFSLAGYSGLTLSNDSDFKLEWDILLQ